VSGNNETLRLGLIGAGPWGRNYIRTIDGLDGVTLFRLASRNPESAGFVGPRCEISNDWRALIKAGDLDGVIVAAPPALHAEMTLAAVDRGLPVLVEKPLTLDIAEAEAVLDRARSKGAIVLVDHIHLYSAAWEALKRESRRLGPLHAVSTVAGNWGPFRKDTPMLWDWGSHDVAMCIDLAGRPPDRSTAHLIETRKTPEGEGRALALELGFGDVAARIAVSNMHKDKQRLFAAAFEGGELIYDDTRDGDGKLRLKTTPDDPGGTFKLGPGLPLERVVLAFAAAIALGLPNMDDVELGLDVVRMLARLEETLIPSE
jgi:predicted dehydrogenase|tara:strand:- start:330 stop:1277 length:948 start_codon:yes stop_codon:yes gene_type:complete